MCVCAIKGHLSLDQEIGGIHMWKRKTSMAICLTELCKCIMGISCSNTIHYTIRLCCTLLRRTSMMGMLFVYICLLWKVLTDHQLIIYLYSCTMSCNPKRFFNYIMKGGTMRLLHQLDRMWYYVIR